MNNGRVRNIEIPENLFSNLGEMKVKKEKELDSNIETHKFINDYEKENDIKLTKYDQKREYRNRITRMHEELDNIKPIDQLVDNVLYFNNYIERGIVVKPKVSSLKQFWTEYRLINNEKTFKKEINNNLDEALNDFDSLFKALSSRVTEINNYIDELKEIKEDIDTTRGQLQLDKEQLKAEKQEFLNYKEHEENKIKEEKENLKINFERLQTIIDDLDKKLGSIEE